MLTESKWISLLSIKWFKLYESYLGSKEMENLLSVLYKLYIAEKVYPSPDKIFRCFKETPLDKLKVIIIGQDPYFDGNATGIAFANENVLTLSPSLREIEKSVEMFCHNGLLIDFDETLINWSKQGVLMLNSALTVKSYSPGSHSHLWINFINFVLKKLNDDYTGLHFCFWGNKAKYFKNLINSKNHFVYEYEHPSYAVRNNRDWKCPNFVDINNNIILQNGKSEIIHW